ncbi:MAG: DNA internalization-related competence protein ComEC/Rec2 [Betaproteobacteria bacterium]|nr:DNA internalization-related competence protein ComEC/Rec2 [Betaproteobacteria bacterium]MCL2887494.1 DNA internalization-related competence protein ComEC/Rec2 [Betaproteobacteria bacterium]
MRSAILAFAAGVLLLQTRAELPMPWPWLAGGLLLASLPLVWRGRSAARILALGGCLLLGFAWAAWRAEWCLADELGRDWEGRDVEVIGTVAGLPQDFARGTRFVFAVEQRLTPGAIVPENIQLAWYRDERRRAATPPAALPAVAPGERWRFTVRLKRPHGGANPGGFDYEAWLLERGVRATGYIRPGPATRLEEFVWRPGHVVERLRAAVRANFRAALPQAEWPWTGILTALAVGDQQAVQSELWSVFNRSGTTHLMSISGLHVTMVAGLIGWLASFVWRRVPALALRLPAQHAGLLAAALGGFVYTLLAGFAVPAQRTLYMLLVVAAAMFSRRQLAPSRILALALLVVLLIDPWAVLAAGFWLSFGAVGALLYIGTAGVGDNRGWLTRVRGWGMVQWAAMLASLPILLLVFQQFPLVSPLANALAVPLISFVITPLALLAALLPWPPLLMLAHTLLDGLMRFLIWCAAWPLWQTPAPPLWAVVAGGVGVAVCLLPRGAPGRLLGLCLLLPALFWPAEEIPEGEARIDVLDVGQGQALAVRTRKHLLIYDPGPQYGPDSDAGQRVVVPYLRWLGAGGVDRLVVSHRDSDHAGGLDSLRAALPVDDLLSSMAELDGELCAAGQTWTWDGVVFAVLHPPAAAYAKRIAANHLSCTLTVTAGTRRVLLTADIERKDEKALLAGDAAALAAEVILVPHHGAKTSSTAAFVAAVGARHALVSAGYRNRFGHPRAEVVARYVEHGAQIWRTDRDGALRVTLRPEGVSVAAWREAQRRYWHGR